MAAQTTLLAPSSYCQRGVPGKQPSVRLANQLSRIFCDFTPLYQKAPIVVGSSNGPVAVAVPMTTSRSGTRNGWLVVFSSRTRALKR